MPDDSEFQTLKLPEAKFVWTRGTDNRLLLEECRERAGMWQLRREQSGLRRAESVMGQCSKFKFNALIDGEPMKMLKNGR